MSLCDLLCSNSPVLLNTLLTFLASMLCLDAPPQYPISLPDATPYAPHGASPCILRRVLRLVLRLVVLRLVAPPLPYNMHDIPTARAYAIQEGGSDSTIEEEFTTVNKCRAEAAVRGGIKVRHVYLSLGR